MTLIISEIGINFNGDLGLARRMIATSKKCGADIAKFQLYDPEKLLDKSLFSEKDWGLILASKLSFENAKELKKCCDDWGIEFMASAFDEERLDWLEQLDVKRHKIASRSVYDIDYCEKVFSTGKEVLVSTGYLHEEYNKNNEDFQHIFYRLFGDHRNSRILYCESKYPTKLEDLTFWKDMFNVIDGFSDHTEGLVASIKAITMGAKIIEKHFTFNKDMDGCDQKGSMEPTDLITLCNFRDSHSKINIRNSMEELY